MAVVTCFLVSVGSGVWVYRDGSRARERRFWAEALYSLADRGDEISQLIIGSSQSADLLEEAFSASDMESMTLAWTRLVDLGQYHEQINRINQLIKQYPGVIDLALEGNLTVADEILLKWNNMLLLNILGISGPSGSSSV